MHMRVHSGALPYACSVCSKKFSYKWNLVSHMKRTHEKQKPYQCENEKCDKRFAAKKDMLIHMRTHSGIKEYQCDICFQYFGHSGTVKKHKQRKHPT